MHLANGAITPECAAITLGAAGVSLGWAAFAARKSPLNANRIALAATLGAFTLAAQAWNVPVLGGASGHLVGGVLLAWAVGPGLAIWTMAGVLFLQALLLGDGGLMAWGANTLNMGVVPALCVVAGKSWFGSQRSAREESLSVAAIAGASIVMAAGLVCVEVAIGRSGGELSLAHFTQQMLGLHLVIGGLEAALTLPLVLMLSPVVRGEGVAIRSRLTALAALAVVLLPISLIASSQLPDGYETAATRAGLETLLSQPTVGLFAAQSEWLSLGAAAMLAAAFAGTAAIAMARAWQPQLSLADLSRKHSGK